MERSPRGSEYPNSKVLGPKIHTLNGFWTLKPYYLGTWTLRVWEHPRTLEIPRLDEEATRDAAAAAGIPAFRWCEISLGLGFRV